MPIICKISLDAEEYRQKLAQVIAESKQAQAALSDLSDRSDLSDKEVGVTADTSQATAALGDLPQVTDQAISVTVDTSQAASAIDALPQATDQAITVTADTSQATAALGDLPQATDQAITVTADTSQAAAALTDLPQVSDQSVTVTADTSQATAALGDLPQVSDQSVTVTADASQAASALDALPQVSDQSVTVTADTSQATAELGDLPQVSDQSVTVTADTSQAQAALSDLSDQSALSDKSFTVTADVSAAQNSLLKVTVDAEKLNKTVAKVPVEGFVANFKNGLAAVRAELNKTTGGAGKFLETFLAGGGGIGIIVAGIASLGKIVQTVYNNWRQRLQENAELHSRNSTSIRESAEANEQMRQKTDGFLSKLQELSSAERLSNSQKAEAVKLIGDLKKSYGDLGIKVDEVAGKLTGVDSAVVKKLQRDKARRSAEIEAELKQVQSEIKQQREIRDTAGIPIWFGGNTRVGGEEETKAASQQIEELSKRAAELNKKRLEVRRSDPVEEFRKQQKAAVEDLKKQLAEQKKITSDSSDMSDQSDPSDKIAFLQKQRDRHQQETLDPLQKKINYAQMRVSSTTGDDKVEAEKQLLQLKIAQQQELQKAYALEKQIKEVKDQQTQAAAQASEKLQKNIKNQGFTLYGQAMTQAGFGKEFAQQKALRDAREVKGSDLTESEKSSVLKLAELSFGLSQRREPALGDLSVKTNALTSRGGFQGGAAVASAERFNREILQTNKSTLSTLKQIQKVCENLGTF